MLATPRERSLIRRPSSSRVTTENASRCCSRTSSAFCGWVACGCAVLVARKMSSPSARSHRTSDGLANWSPDHRHPRPACVLRSVRQYGVKAAASSGSKETASVAALLISEFCNKICHKLTHASQRVARTSKAKSGTFVDCSSVKLCEHEINERPDFRREMPRLRIDQRYGSGTGIELC